MLKTGWYDGTSGDYPHPENIKNVYNFCTDIINHFLPLPEISPTGENEICISWVTNNNIMIDIYFIKSNHAEFLCKDEQIDFNPNVQQEVTNIIGEISKSLVK